MEHLFILRHGEYEKNSKDGSLTFLGRKQVRDMAVLMKQILGDNYSDFYLISSTANRAKESSVIIKELLGLKYFDVWRGLETKGGLNLSLQHNQDIESIIERNKGKHSAVGIMTHYEVVGSYPMYIFLTKFQKDSNIERPAVGQGIHIDLKNQKCNYLR